MTEDNRLTLYDNKNVEITPTGLSIKGDMPIEEWIDLGDWLRFYEGAIQWLIGDWLVEGDLRYGELAAQGYSEQQYNTWRNYYYVSQNVKDDNRLSILTWGHHREVAGLKDNLGRIDKDAQAYWLQEAIDNCWNRNELRAAIRDDNKIEPPPMEGKYRVIYADPPWSYGDKLIEGYGAADHHYTQMSIKELCELPVREVAEDNAVLFMWVTSPLLEECFEVIRAWGFEYKTSFVWDKIKHNYGHYNSVRHEFLLVCGRGSATPDIPELFDSVQEIERSSVHSEKPEEFRQIIDALYTHGNKIELFARQPAEGWEVWGDEIG